VITRGRHRFKLSRAAYSVGSYADIDKPADMVQDERCQSMNSPIRVLLIDDDSDYVALVEQWLLGGTESTFVLRWANSLTAGLAHLKQYDVDVILLDLGLPDSGGLETFSKIKMQADNVPLILLSGDSAEELAIKLVGFSPQESLIYKSSSNSDSLATAILDSFEN